MNTLNIDLETIRKSSNIADSFLNENKHLSSVHTYSEYNNRAAGFSALVNAECGWYSFTPVIKMNVEIPWQTVLRESEQFDYLNIKTETQGSAADALRDLYWKVFYLSHADIIARRVSAEILEYIKQKKQEYPEQFKPCPSSPKLTKLVGWMFGEKAGGAMDYLTTKCPREDKAGALDEYRIFVSVLPHNVAGMSYYSSGNHGGANWQGYSGTSCQDPERSHDHSLINHLPASIKEQTLATAWIAKRENNDIWSPVYEARVNIRIVPFFNKELFLICNPYYTNPTVKHVLVEGLKNEFDGLMIYAPDTSVWGCETTDIEIDIEYCYYEGRKVDECHHCNGHGEIENDCHQCDGTGWERPECECCYGSGEIENGDEWETCEDCNGYGYKEIECCDCDGHGHFTEECDECGGSGNLDEYDDEYLPYIDDTAIIAIDGEMITYTLPNDLLVEMGVMNEEGEYIEA
jgi:hypothetical protein